jgi:hypothetical protein
VFCASTCCPTETLEAMCQYWNVRPLPPSTAIQVFETERTVPDSTG